MKISQIKISNFRGYYDQTTVDIGDLTVFIGKNDIGKSTILEALDIFFNEGKGMIKIDTSDINKKGLSEGNSDIAISVVFDDLPLEIIIDSTNKTNLEDEYLLNVNGKLEVMKKYPSSGKEKVFIKANHPQGPNCSDLLLKKQAKLKEIVEKENIRCGDKTKNAVMRKAIWTHYSKNMKLEEIEIDVTKEDAKNIWEKLKSYIPLYSLFQSDRKNSDGDSEIQDPMKLAVQEIIKYNDLQSELQQIAKKVNDKLREVADGTLEKLKEMNPDIAKSLNPVIPTAENLKWADVFKNVSISGDDDIPINKRGSGVKRLVLFSFFRAEAERKRHERNISNIIYAIEEPETSQHSEHQRKLIEALIDLSKNPKIQIILTTHSSFIVKMLHFQNLKLIQGEHTKEVINVEKNSLPYPSLNEVNFLAFNECDEGYHIELYGFIDSKNFIKNFRLDKPMRPYKKIMSNGTIKKQDIILSEYIRHQISHPENKHNERYTPEELKESIIEMRLFISKNSR